MITAYLELFEFVCRIETSPKCHTLSGIHMNKLIQSKVGLLELLLSHNTFFSLCVFLFTKVFFFTKKVEEGGKSGLAKLNLLKM